MNRPRLRWLSVSRLKPTGGLAFRILIVGLVLVAVLIMLLRMSEFAGHPVRRERRLHPVPVLMMTPYGLLNGGQQRK